MAKQRSSSFLFLILCLAHFIPTTEVSGGMMDRFRNSKKVYNNLVKDFNRKFLPDLAEYRLATAYNASIEVYASYLPRMMKLKPDQQRMQGLSLYRIVKAGLKAQHALSEERGMMDRLRRGLTLGTTTFKKWFKRISTFSKRLMKERRKGGAKGANAMRIFINLRKFRTFVQQTKQKVVASWGAIQRYCGMNNIPIHKLRKLKKILKKLKKKFKKIRRSKSWAEFREDLDSGTYAEGHKGDKADKKAMKRIARIEKIKDYLNDKKRTLGFEYGYYMRQIAPYEREANQVMEVVWNTTVKSPGFFEKRRGIGNKHHVLEYIEKYHEKLGDEVEDIMEEIEEIKEEADTDDKSGALADYNETVDDLEEFYEDDLRELPGKLDGKISLSRQKRYLRHEEAIDLSARVGDLRRRIELIRQKIYKMKRSAGREITSSLGQALPENGPVMMSTPQGGYAQSHGNTSYTGYAQESQQPMGLAHAIATAPEYGGQQQYAAPTYTEPAPPYGSQGGGGHGGYDQYGGGGQQQSYSQAPAHGGDHYGAQDGGGGHGGYDQYGSGGQQQSYSQGPAYGGGGGHSSYSDAQNIW